MNSAPGKKIVWAEGLLLGPQHFQQWDHYIEGQQRLRFRLSHPFNWGIFSLVYDEDALLQGRVVIQECGVVFQNGRLVQFSAVEHGSLVLNLPTETGGDLVIYVCLPAGEYVDGISGYEKKQSDVAWRAHYEEVGDLYDLDRRREVLFGAANLYLSCEEVGINDENRCPLIKVTGIGKGAFKECRRYVPPVLQARVSGCLENWTRRQLSLLVMRQRTLENMNAAGNMRHLSGELLMCRMLSCLMGRFRQEIEIYLCHFEIHPLVLFKGFLCFLGELSGWCLKDQTEMPCYQHLDLMRTFEGVESCFERLLTEAVPDVTQYVEFKKTGEGLYLTGSLKNLVKINTQYFLVVKWNDFEEGWESAFVRQVKLGESGSIEAIMASALPGVRIRYVPQFSSEMVSGEVRKYFRLELSEEAREGFCAGQSLAVFLPSAFMSAEMQLLLLSAG